MAPHRNAHRSNASPFEQLDRIKNFAKQIQMFKVYGDERHEVRLRNGDVVVGGECVEIKQGKDYSGTSYHGERWYAEVVEIKGENEDSGDMELPPGRCAVEKCTKRYNPDEDFQRLCPRLGCGLWFHNKCLENVRFERTSRWTLRHRLEAMLTGTKELISDMDGNDWELGNAVPAECYKWFSEEVKKEVKGVPGCQFPTYEIGSISNVVWCAQTPISRGCRYGVVGNEEAVAKARMILKEIWNGGRKNGRPEDRQVEWFKNCNPPTQRLFSCMRCGLAI
ncbi:hypothetical protein FRC07_005172 [Ceratobasidium sp. 392]|nr:hypothetical protein FRC07_005172 [Ceratobasidium sp. 392]